MCCRLEGIRRLQRNINEKRESASATQERTIQRMAQVLPPEMVPCLFGLVEAHASSQEALEYERALRAADGAALSTMQVRCLSLKVTATHTLAPNL